MKKVLLVLVVVVVAALLVAVIANRMSVRNHMEQVNREVMGLALQLGYTPDSLLRYEKGARDFNFVPPDVRCMNQIFFETPMTVEQFTKRLKTAAPSAIAEGMEENWSDLFQYFDFDVEHADSAEAQAFLTRKRQTAYFWRLPNGGARIRFYDMLNLPATFAYKGQSITGNVVEIYMDGGRFIPEFGCPIETIERM